jgi:hypothetical protein
MKDVFEKMSPNQIMDFLEANADDITEQFYMKPLSVDEIEEVKDRFINDSIQLQQNQEELKAIKEQYALTKIKPLQSNLENDRGILKTGKIGVTGRLYTLRNFEDNMVVTYDVNGSIISERRMTPSDKQLNVFKIERKTA